MTTRPASLEPEIFTAQTIYCGDWLEPDRLQHQPAGGKDSPVHIIPVRIDELTRESFKLDLLLHGAGSKLV